MKSKISKKVKSKLSSRHFSFASPRGEDFVIRYWNWRLLAMINYQFMNSLMVSHGTKSETVSEFRTDLVTHLATKQWQHESLVVQCCFDYFNRKIVIGLVLPYGSQLKNSIYLFLIQALSVNSRWSLQFDLHSALVVRDHLVFGCLQSCENSYERLVFWRRNCHILIIHYGWIGSMLF